MDDTRRDDLVPDTGISDPRRVAASLSEVLNATYELLIRTHEVHWNIEGPMFYGVHMLTEEQYKDLFAAADDLAERIRALGLVAPSQPGSLPDLSAGAEARVGAAAMIDALRLRHEALARACHRCIREAEDADDPVTADLCTARSAAHEKAAWMLRAMTAA